MAETLRTGEVHSKRHGAAWAKKAMDPRWRGLIDRAERQRLRPIAELAMPADTRAVAETRSFIRYVVELRS
jgi:hypothetical protein